MIKSFLILGREPHISFAEICQYFGESAKIGRYGPNFVFLADNKIGSNAPHMFGGVPKSGFVIDKIKKSDSGALSSVLADFAKEGEKFHFGFSAYAIGNEKINFRKIKVLGLETKRLLKQAGYSVRMVESKGDTLSSVDVVKNKLIDKGVELCLFFSGDDVFVGKTESVQPFEEYSLRDYGRPARDMKRGMIPPKLARSMVNMSGAKEGELVFDPFCGTGTILQEALLRGRRALGTDINESAVRDARKNIEWLLARTKSLPEYKVEAKDARELGDDFKEWEVASIVSELDLGPPLSGNESKQKVESIESSLSEFYFEALRAMNNVINTGSRAVIAIPYFPGYKMFVSDLSSFSGWKFIKPYPEDFFSTYPLSARGTLLYGRAGQNVFREVLILEKI